MKKTYLTKESMISFKYGDVILVDFNPVRGAEISKIRPCIVVSHDVLNKNSPLCIVIPITSNTDRILPFHVFIIKSKENGLTVNSKAIPEQIKSLDKTRIIKRLGSLEKNYQNELVKKIAFVLNQGEIM